MMVVKVRKAVEEGRLDPVARDVAVSIAKGTFWEDVCGHDGSIWGLIVEVMNEELTPERAAKMRARLLAYEGVCEELGLEVEHPKAIGIALAMTEPDLRGHAGYNHEGGDDETEH